MSSKHFPTLAQFEEKFFMTFDIILIVSTGSLLISEIFSTTPWLHQVMAALAFFGIIPVAISALKTLVKKKISVDMLATIALAFSLISHEWSSAAFITLMLAFARVFDQITQARAKKTIQSLMKYHVESVRIRIGDTVKEVHISQVRTGDLVLVESGDRIPVDGIVMSGIAEVDESTLTGESELVPKKNGDKVFTSTMNESGSLIVKTERVGADTTLARMVSLVEEASRDKNQSELAADRFTQWYIVISLVLSIGMYIYGIHPKIILSILLVVCADDIAVAVPLAYTAAIAYAARRGVIVKGSSAFEQLSKVKYILTDKTGTLTRGKPKVVDVKMYGLWTREEIAKRFVGGAAESRHAVSRAIMEYAVAYSIKPHLPDELEEIPGQGISFSHDGEAMLMGRASFMEARGSRISAVVKKDIQTEKDSGRGIVCLSINGEVVGLLSYVDELRPQATTIITDTKKVGVLEWHMLTGDNSQAASLIARELNLRHYHSDLTPEGKVDFIRKFEKEHSSTKSTVAYIGDGVNDAASLALADVSIAMGGIGADAAIEASDVTIMKDHIDRVPEIISMAQKVRRVMVASFWIWGITNAFGLVWVTVGIPGLGLLGPAGAATYNFLTDFIPIINALRAGRK
ncbi:MAG: cation-translocating P-type ATPase [Candidatus Taylorbacteria bacterium]